MTHFYRRVDKRDENLGARKKAVSKPLAKYQQRSLWSYISLYTTNSGRNRHGQRWTSSTRLMLIHQRPTQCLVTLWSRRSLNDRQFNECTQPLITRTLPLIHSENTFCNAGCKVNPRFNNAQWSHHTDLISQSYPPPENTWVFHTHSCWNVVLPALEGSIMMQYYCLRLWTIVLI